MITFAELAEIEKLKKEQHAPEINLDQHEIDERSTIILQLQSAKEQRDKGQKEFDDMDYLTWYETNLHAANSYIKARENPEDVRIVTGMTREKETNILSSLLNYNLSLSLTPFLRDNSLVAGLGVIIEDLVKKSRELEGYDQKRALIYREFLDQGDVFVEECVVEDFIVEKNNEFNWEEGVTTKGYDPKKRIKKIGERLESKLLSGTKVYFGNIKEPQKDKQPFLFTVETTPYDNVMAEFMNWDRWQFVPRKIIRMQDTMDTTGYRDWTLLTTRENYVEVIKYYNKPKNVFQIFLNGVPMLPAEFPLTAIMPKCEYPISHGQIEPMPFFCYAKGVPAKTKVDQQVIDEMYKLAILKTQQSFKPPLANNTGKKLARDVFYPGVIKDNLDVTKINPIITPTGVTAAELGFMEYMRGIIDLKSVSAIFTGTQGNRKLTATQVNQMKQAEIMKLGLTVWGVVQLEHQMAALRIQAIIEHWTKAQDTRVNDAKDKLENVYKSFTLESDLENGQKGRKIISFDPNAATKTPEQVMMEEELLTAKDQIPTRKIYVDPDALRSLDLYWKILITPTENNAGDLQRVLFVQNIEDAARLFGPQSLNMEYLKERFAILAKEDPKKFFSQAPAQNTAAVGPGMPGTPGAPPAGGEGVGGDVGAQVMASLKKPGIKQMQGK